MSALDLVERTEDGTLATTSLIIADGTGNDHASVLRLIRNNLTDFEDFGRVGFENRPFETAGGTQNRTVAVLNREHAMFAMTLFRNNDIVVDFKKRLIHAFVALEQRAAAPALPDRRSLARMVIEAEDRADAAQRQIEQDAPKVEHYDRFLSDDSDVLTLTDWGAQFGMTKNQTFALLISKKIIYRKSVTREMSQKKGMQVDRMEHRAYAPFRDLFDLRQQEKAPRYNNGQLRQTLYVYATRSLDLARAAGIDPTQTALTLEGANA